MQRVIQGLFLLFLLSSAAVAEIEVNIAYLERRVAPPPTLSNLDPVPEDEGLRGAELGLADNATTGKFLMHSYTLETFVAEAADDFRASAAKALAAADYIVVNAPAADLLVVADLAEAEGKILLNAGAPDNVLRGPDCRADLFHTLPSRAMLGDALAQFAVYKKWTDWALVAGPRDEDKALAAAFEASASKFGVRIRARKDWAFDADMRRNASAEVPLFTQDLGDYHMLVIADEANDFARYVMYNTWQPRPVAGSEGMVPTAWARSVEQHGAAQLQSRFVDLAGRYMRSIDWAAWAAVRSVGEAVTRTNSADVDIVRDFMLGDGFELGGFKGRKLSYRRWNGQLRQPIPLVHPGALVALAPMEGFLHRVNEMDTLGLDESESACSVFGEK